MNSRELKAARLTKLARRYAAMADPLFGVEPIQVEPQQQRRTPPVPVSDEQIVQHFNRECRRPM
jgi:hypothetical protein